MKNTAILIERITRIYLFIILIYFSMAPLRNIIPLKLISLLSFALFAIYLILSEKMFFFIKRNIFFFCFLCFIFIKSIFALDNQPMSEYHDFRNIFSLCIVVFIFINFIFILEGEKNKTKYIKAFFSFYHISIFIGIIGLLIYGNVYRYSLSTEMFYMPTVDFIFSSSIICAYAFYQSIFSKRYRKVSLLSCLINLIYILLSGYSIQIIFTLFSFFVIILKYFLKENRKVIYFLLAMIILIVLLREFVGETIIYLYKNGVFSFLHPDMKERIADIGHFFSNDISLTTDLQFRFEVYKTSIDTFLNNAIIGVPFKTYNTIVLNVGGHSQWFDMLARYGILGNLLLILWTRTRIKRIPKGSFISSLILVLFIGFYGFLNPIIDFNLFLIVYLVAFTNKETKETNDDFFYNSNVQS